AAASPRPRWRARCRRVGWHQEQSGCARISSALVSSRFVYSFEELEIQQKPMSSRTARSADPGSKSPRMYALRVRSRLSLRSAGMNVVLWHYGQLYSPNTYSTVAWRMSRSSGVLTRRDLPAAVGPDAIATYCLPFTSKVIGGAVKPEPTLIFQIWSSVVSS